MTDLTKCAGLHCPERNECLRYRSPPRGRDSWSDFDSIRRLGTECERRVPLHLGGRQPELMPSNWQEADE